MMIGALTAVANGAGAMMMLGNTSRWTATQIAEATLFASIGFALVLLGALSMAGRAQSSRVLNWQTIALGGLVCLLTLWGLTIALSKPDEQTAISWMVGILSALAIYVYYLVRHAVDPNRFAMLRRILLGACTAAIMVDVGVFARVGWF